MNELITQHLLALTNAEEEDRLVRWRRASRENDAKYRRRLRLWRRLGMLEPSASRVPPTAAGLIARAGIRHLPNSHRLTLEGPPSSRGRRLLALALPAAAVILIVTSALVTGALLNARSAPAVTFRPVEFIDGPNQTHTIRLSDGTIVRMARGARIEFNEESRDIREVTFEGAGYFAVAHDEKRPFVIRTPGGEARVLGTRFELRTEEDAVRVVVVEGRVALEAAGRRQEVAANQIGHAGARKPPSVLNVENVDDYLGWITGLYVFQATPLSQVAAELSRHFGISIRIADPELGDREVTAWLRDQSFDAVLTALCEAVGAVCAVGDEGAIMHLRGRGSAAN